MTPHAINNMSEEFRDFLKLKSCLQEFITHTLATNRQGATSGIKGPLKEDWVSGEFTWEGTPEGHHYWYSISKAWHDYIQDKHDLYNANEEPA